MTTKPRIICIGAVTQDVFMQGEIFKPHRDESGMVEEFQLGSKNTVDAVTFSTGGGASNAAVTFTRQGMHASYLGKIGDDLAGRAIREVLREEGVDTTLMSVSHKFGTGFSVLLLAPSGERTILVYRGASTHYELESEDFHDKSADWFYISSLEGNFEVLETALSYAAKHNIKVALNPGKKELKEAARLRRLLSHCSVLALNKEELAMLFHGDTLAELVAAAGQTVPYVVGTDGPKGSVATDGTHIYKAGMYKDVKVIDRTGAGDAFASGFTAMIARSESMEQALTFASANSTSVVQHIGAKTGILRQKSRLNHMTVRISKMSDA